jgi:hypothetical protein
MHYESEGGVVPMLCPGCCTLADLPDGPQRDAASLKTAVGCHRCGFTFPALPGQFKSLTLDALHNHRCQGPDAGNWDAVGKAIIEELGQLQHDPELLAVFFTAASGQPDGEPPGKTAPARPAAPQPGGLASPGPRPRRVAKRQP